jgi:hypothetical protein
MGGVGKEGERVEGRDEIEANIPATKNLLCDCFGVVIICFKIILVWYYWYKLVVF